MAQQVGSIVKLSTKGSIPSVRHSSCVASIGGNVYIFGGTKEDFNTHTDEFYNDLYCFDINSNTCTELAVPGDGPSPRSTAGAIGLEKRGEILIFGGTYYEAGFSNIKMFNELWSYSINKNRWTKLEPSHPPAPRAKPMVWRADGKLYVFGGITPQFQILNDFWVYDPENNTWTELQSEQKPSGRLESRGGSYDNKLIIYGGESLEPGQKHFKMLGDIWQYDIKNEQWSNITPQQNNISIHNYACAGIIDDYLYLIAGDIKDLPGAVSGFGAPFPQNICNEIWRFDLNKHAWEQLEVAGEQPPAIKQASTVTIKDKMYIFGGFGFINPDGKGPGQIWNHDIFMYDPKAS